MSHPLATWENGDERDVPEDLKIPVKIRRDQPVRIVRAIDALLTSGPDFVDAQTGLNPDFVCSHCGRETLSDFYLGVDPITQGGKQIPYEDENGNKLCPRDYLLLQPKGSWAWQYHGGVEKSRDFEEAIAALHERGEDTGFSANLGLPSRLERKADAAAQTEPAAPAESVPSAFASDPVALRPPTYEPANGHEEIA